VQSLTDPTPITCRFCGKDDGRIVLDLGRQPSSELFPEVGDAGPDPVYPLRMWLCATCGLAQLADDTVVPEEVLGRAKEVLAELESHPMALRERPTAPGRRRRRDPGPQPGLFDGVSDQ